MKRIRYFIYAKNWMAGFLFEIAAEMEFKCPFCGGELIFEENEPVIEALKQRIVQLEDMTSSSGAAA